MTLKLRALLAVSLLSLMASSASAYQDWRNYPPIPANIPMTSGLALACAMIHDYYGNDQLWFENVEKLFGETDAVSSRATIKDFVTGGLESGEPIKVWGVFKRWVGPNAFILEVGYEEVLVVGKKDTLSDRSLNANSLWVVGSYFNGLSDMCQQGQGGERFIRADQIFSEL